MLITRVPVEVNGRRMMDTQKIAIYVEADPQGDIFVKTEAQNGPYIALIEFNYDIDQGIEKFIELIRQVVPAQVEKLKKEVEEIEK